MFNKVQNFSYPIHLRLFFRRVPEGAKTFCKIDLQYDLQQFNANAKVLL